MNTIRTGFILVSTVLLGTGCAKSSFSSGDGKYSVFSSVTGLTNGDATGNLTQGANGGGNATGNLNQGANGGGNATGNLTQTGTTTTLPINTYCDTIDSKRARTNAYTATSVTLTVVDSTGTVVCSIADASSDIQTTGSDLNLSGCPNLPPGNYGLSLNAPNSKYNLLIDGLTGKAGNSARSRNLPMTTQPVPVTIDANGVWSSDTIVYVLWDTNPKDFPANEGNAMCETTGASPLIIDLNATSKNPNLVEMTSMADGVSFNILGQNAAQFGLPANTPTKISWFKNSNYGILALPAIDGQVHGIDQLFGNNTRLPDGTFRENGYQALAYYDKNHDGVIDKKDPIFSQLRIWKSNVSNFKKAPAHGELWTLSQLGITKINLNYTRAGGNPKLAQGNPVRFRSTVVFADGKHNMYDLWFSVKMPETPQPVLAPLARHN